jgi:small basic protein
MHTDHSGLLRRSYSALLRFYPAAVRSERGTVELDTLLEVSSPGQRLPKVREARALIASGLRARLVLSAGSDWRSVVANGLSWGVGISMVMQFWFTLAMLMKAISPYNSQDHAETVSAFSLWALATLALTIAWTQKPNRVVLGIWQVINVSGAVWLGMYIHKRVPEVLDVYLSITAIATLSCIAGVVAIVLDRQAEGPTCKLRGPNPLIILFAALFPVFSTLVLPALIIIPVATIGVLIISTVDPRPLIAVIGALTVPLIVLCVNNIIGAHDVGAKQLACPLILCVLSVLTYARSKVLLRRLETRY